MISCFTGRLFSEPGVRPARLTLREDHPEHLVDGGPEVGRNGERVVVVFGHELALDSAAVSFRDLVLALLAENGLVADDQRVALDVVDADVEFDRDQLAFWVVHE